MFAPTVEEKTSHIPYLAEAGLRMGFCDPGSLNLGPTDDAGIPLAPGMAIFEPGFLRTAMAWTRAGRMPRGAFLRLYLGGASSYRGVGPVDLLFGLPPIPASVDTYVDMMEAEGIELPWSVAVVSGSTVENGVAQRALERKGNVELVREAVAVCEAVGRPVARADEMAKLLDLPPRGRW